MIFRDKSGDPLELGDIIIYAVMNGDSPSLRYGKVIGFKSRKQGPFRFCSSEVKLRVVGIDDYGEIRAMKPAYLEYSERVLRVTSYRVPEIILRELDAISIEKETE